MSWNDKDAQLFIVNELASLWADLYGAERSSRSYDPDKPSMAMLDIMSRIKRATELVGPVDWMKVSVPFIRSGSYKRWAEYMGIEYTYPTDEMYQRHILRITKK